MFSSYIFDLDGTLINSSKEVLLCFKKAFKKANYPVKEERLNSNVIGPPLRDIIRIIAPELKDEELIGEIENNFRELYDYDENDISELYPGVPDILSDLKRQGKRIFLATFKPKKPTERILRQFKLEVFEDVYTIDKFEKHITKAEMIEDIIKKYSLLKSETAMVGDAKSDMTAAKEAKVTAIGALWGYGTDKAPLRETADYCINNLKELICQK
ncbi:HAD family hydrolase [bacterium]|nr:HAD family hydrolase [bacterium]